MPVELAGEFVRSEKWQSIVRQLEEVTQRDNLMRGWSITLKPQTPSEAEEQAFGWTDVETKAMMVCVPADAEPSVEVVLSTLAEYFGRIDAPELEVVVAKKVLVRITDPSVEVEQVEAMIRGYLTDVTGPFNDSGEIFVEDEQGQNKLIAKFESNGEDCALLKITQLDGDEDDEDERDELDDGEGDEG